MPLNLEDVIVRDGPIPWQEFWDRFGEPLLEAIAFAHKSKIAHRDVKPKNILVTDDGTAKLADYGVAKLLDNGGSWAPVSGITFRFDRTPDTHLRLPRKITPTHATATPLQQLPSHV